MSAADDTIRKLMTQLKNAGVDGDTALMISCSLDEDNLMQQMIRWLGTKQNPTSREIILKMKEIFTASIR